ncbi:hypothetical protein QL285_084707 [Trifolium repens]|nr:hypothetical protein QL285_084707 [Trifolium repens]
MDIFAIPRLFSPHHRLFRSPEEVLWWFPRWFCCSGEVRGGFRSVSLRFCSICFVLLCFNLFGGVFGLFLWCLLFTVLFFQCGWCFNGSGGDSTPVVVRVLCYLTDWSVLFPATFCFWFMNLGGDSDDSELEVTRGVVVAMGWW